MFLDNTILQSNSTSDADPVSDISQTSLIDRYTFLAVPDFHLAIERKFSQLVLAIMSDTPFAPTVNVSAVPCTVTRQIQRWRYEPFWLVVSYGVGAAVASVVVAAGWYAFRATRYGVDTASFSTLIALTRNGELDELMEGCSLGRAPLPSRVLEKRLRFGDITALRGDGNNNNNDDDECGGDMVRRRGSGMIRRAGFGSEMAVRPIEVGERYS